LAEKGRGDNGEGRFFNGELKMENGELACAGTLHPSLFTLHSSPLTLHPPFSIKKTFCHFFRFGKEFVTFGEEKEKDYELE
jgi:hypothetical protein